MDDPELLVEADGGVLTVTFNRPRQRNAMTWGMYEGLYDACERADADDEIRVMVLKAAGDKAFVAGTDISQFADFSSGADGVAYEEKIARIVTRLEDVGVPTVAVVRGFCVGGGLGIASVCDLRVAARSARFGIPIARTLGNCLSMANIAGLVAMFGRPRVQRLLLLADMVGAEEAQACGYVLEVVPAEGIEAAAQKLCSKLASLAPVTQQVSKEALNRLLRHGLPDAEDLIRRTYGSEDFREGVTAFVGKRPPVWKGR